MDFLVGESDLRVVELMISELKDLPAQELMDTEC